MDVEGEGRRGRKAGKGGGGFWEDGDEGEEVNRSHSGRHAERYLTATSVQNDCPKPLFPLVAFVLLQFSPEMHLQQILI